MKRPSSAAAEGADELFRSVTRLAPNAGVHFIDIEIPVAVIDGVARAFSVERVSLEDGGLWALGPPKSLTGDPDKDGTRLRADGRSAVKAAMDRWVPLPLLRFISRDGEGRPRFDEGPNNWVRMYLGGGGVENGVVRGVIAVDTSIERRSRLDLDTYTAPTADDVQFSSMFALTDEAERLAPFLSEGWVQDWIEQVFPTPEMRSTGTVPGGHGLSQLASYLALLTVVRRAGVLPSLQFFEARTNVVPAVPVDLVLDIGHSRSCCMLVESSLANGRPIVDHAALLGLRDLSQPVEVYPGTFDSRLQFSRAAFGPEALSRRSGRIDAFHWPSLARTGAEAVRLSCATRTDDGATGLASPKRHLADQTLRGDTWRFALDRRTSLQKSPMLAGRLLITAGESTAKLLTGPEGSVRPLSLRPRFALSTMMSFLIAELVLQALAAINAPVVDTGIRARAEAPSIAAAAARRAEGIRRLRHIIVCVPLTLPLDERQLMRERAEAAVDMLWRALDWDERADGAMPPRPTVRLGLDETLAAQLVYLFDEVGQRFGGDVRNVMSTIGKYRPDFGVEPCLRVGALDIGGGHTTMTVVTYGQVADQPVAPTLLGAQRSDIGGEVVVDRIIGELIIPVLARALSAHGLERPEGFLARQAASPGVGAAYDIAAASTRLYEHWLRPAAIGLLSLAHDAPGGEARIATRLSDMIVQGGAAPNLHVAEEFMAAAVDAGAAGFDLGAVEMRIRLGEVMTVVKTALAPMVVRLSRALVASDCDVVLLTGWAARLAPVRDLLLEAMPWRPDRIVDLTERAWLDWYPMTAEARQASDGKDIGLIGALLALSGGGMGLASSDFAGDDAVAFGDGRFQAPGTSAPEAPAGTGSRSAAAAGGRS